MGDDEVFGEAQKNGQEPDATVDEVGAAAPGVGFDGRPMRSPTGNGQGTGDPGGPGWSGWAGGSGF
jgi:hypothetical protein